MVSGCLFLGGNLVRKGEHPEVLVVSKAMVPPWDDGTKTLVRELVENARGFRFRVPVPKGMEDVWRENFLLNRVIPWPVYPALDVGGEGGDVSGKGEMGGMGGMGGSVGGAGGGGGLRNAAQGAPPSMREKLELMVRLLMVRGVSLRHFFFAPNMLSSMASKLVKKLRGGPVIQTVCSAPKSYAGVERLLFGDRVVVLSEDTLNKTTLAGISRERLRLIPPGVSVPAELDDEVILRTRRKYGIKDGERCVLYAGDYDFSQAARTTLEAAVRGCGRDDRVCFIFAGRIKNEMSADLEQRMKALVAQKGLADRVVFYNLLEDFLDLLGAVDVTVLPAESVYAKVDLPLTLLEAMARKTPVIVADSGPLPELIRDGSKESGSVKGGEAKGGEAKGGEVKGGEGEGELGLGSGSGLGSGNDDGMGDFGVNEKFGSTGFRGGMVVPPQDAEKLSDALLSLLGNGRWLREMGEEAREVVKERFSSEVMAGAYEDLYRELLT